MIGHLENKGKSGETFHAVVEYLFVTKPAYCVFENVFGAPWHKMQQFIEGSLHLWEIFEGVKAAVKGGGSEAQLAKAEAAAALEQPLDFKVGPDGELTVGNVPKGVGARPYAVLRHVRIGADDSLLDVLPASEYGWAEGEFVTIHALVGALNLEWAEDTLLFETPARFKTKVLKLDTKEYGLPQTRQRGYMFVWQPDRIFDGAHLPGAPAPKESEVDIGELWLEMMEHLQEAPEYALTAFLPPDTAAHSIRFREVLNGPVALKSARDLATKNSYFSGQSKDRAHTDGVRGGGPHFTGPTGFAAGSKMHGDLKKSGPKHTLSLRVKVRLFTVTVCANPANDLTCPPSYIKI